MTFDQIVQKVKDYCSLSSTEATTRIGNSVNAHYRRVTSALGLNASRFVTRTATMTVGSRSVTFNEIEKIDRVLDATDSTSVRGLQEVSIHHLRTMQPESGAPTQWATKN